MITDFVAQAIDHVDLSQLTFDPKYQEQRRRRRQCEVNTSLEDGLWNAADHLLNGVYGISDIAVKPGESFKRDGLYGIPQGLCCGIVLCLVKLVDGLLGAIRALFLGISHCFRCHFRTRRASTRTNRRWLPVVGPSVTSARRVRAAAHEPTKNTAGPMEPMLRGKDFLRHPRLLFGEGGAIVPFIRWHAEVFAMLGPELTQGLCAAWRLSGDEHDAVHLVAIASHTQLFLIDLNKGKHVERRRTARRLTAKKGADIQLTEYRRTARSFKSV